MRESRKLDHLKYAMLLPDGPSDNSFNDMELIHNCMPEFNYEDISLNSNLLDLNLHNPIIINAITGGADDVLTINKSLAKVAKATNCAIAVGSQYAGIENELVRSSYEIVREANPEGIVIANLGAYAKVDDAKNAIEMIQANALQIHLNVGQEIIMPEGDRHFANYFANIMSIIKEVDIPVIIKEVGCGIAKEQAEKLITAGVKIFDVGGKGGTNFIAIEARRNENEISNDFLNWGIPTLISALEVKSVLTAEMELIISGGIRKSLDIVKALTIGASAVGIAKPFVEKISNDGVTKTIYWVEELLEDIKKYMLLMGADNLQKLKNKPFVVNGNTGKWLELRGIDLKGFAGR